MMGYNRFISKHKMTTLRVNRFRDRDCSVRFEITEDFDSLVRRFEVEAEKGSLPENVELKFGLTGGAYYGCTGKKGCPGCKPREEKPLIDKSKTCALITLPGLKVKEEYSHLTMNEDMKKLNLDGDYVELEQCHSVAEETEWLYITPEGYHIFELLRATNPKYTIKEHASNFDWLVDRLPEPDSSRDHSFVKSRSVSAFVKAGFQVRIKVLNNNIPDKTESLIRVLQDIKKYCVAL